MMIFPACFVPDFKNKGKIRVLKVFTFHTGKKMSPKKPVFRGFLVAAAGFEPTTFGL